MNSVKNSISVVALLLLVSFLFGCTSARKQPLAMNGPTEFGTHIVGLIAEKDGRERAVGNIRAVNTSENAEVKLVKATIRDAQNVEAGVFHLLRYAAETDVAGTGYPLPPLPGDDLYEITKPSWDASEQAGGSIIQPGESINLIVGFAQEDPLACGVFEGVDVTYESEGITYGTTWKTRYVVEVDEGAGCERIQTVR